MEAALHALLAGYAPLTALVSTRIYWNHYPQSAADPAVRLTKVTGAPGYHMQGSDGLQASIVQIDVRALTFGSAVAVRNAIVSRLHAKRIEQGTIEFKGIFLRDEQQTFEKTDTESYHRFRLDFDVSHGTAG